MADHDNILLIDTDSPPQLIHFGEDLWLESLPVGTRVIHANPPLPALDDLTGAVRQAVRRPLGCEPLSALLQPGMKVTIALDDISLPVPPMRIDPRQAILEVVLEMLGDAGVDDVQIVIAIGLHRRMKPAELRRMVGSAVFDSFYPERLTNHDPEDPEGIVCLGHTDDGIVVELNRRAVESDLLIYANINQFAFCGGFKSVTVGLSTYRTMRAHHNPQTLRATGSYHDPECSQLHRDIAGVGRVVHEQVRVFHIETVINNRLFGAGLDFLNQPEHTLSRRQWLALRALRASLRVMPLSARRQLFARVPAGYGVVDVIAGSTEEAHPRTLARCFAQYDVPVRGQADVMIIGVPFTSVYSINSFLNPLLVQVQALGYMYSLHHGTPVLRPGGTLIVCHPCGDQFDSSTHPSYEEFFNRLLPQTRDAAVLFDKYEEEFATDPSYLEQFRRGYSYHGVHPFYVWYWGEPGRRGAKRIIAAGPQDRHVTDILGWERAATLGEALDMARDGLASEPQVTLLHVPPVFYANVEI